MTPSPRTWLFVLAALIAGVGSIQFWQGQKFEDTVEVLLTAKASDIEALCIMKNYTCAYRITQSAEISTFLSAIADVEKFSAPKASEGESVVELLVEPHGIGIQSRMRASDDFAFGSIGVVDGPRSTKTYGSFRSVQLRKWIESNIASTENVSPKPD